jgi:hypothetical protein
MLGRETPGLTLDLLGLCALDLGLAIAGASDYVPPEERLSLAPAPVVEQFARVAPGSGCSGSVEALR